MKEKLLESVEQAVNDELLRSLNEYGFNYFNSDHEGYAVIKEEYEEAAEELVKVNAALHSLWKNVKSNTNYTERYAKELYEDALNLIGEAIQIAAMAQKFVDSHKVRH